MKISRLKLIPVLCFALAFALIITFYINSYNETKEQLAFVEKNVEVEELKTGVSEKTNTEKSEVEQNSTEKVVQAVKDVINPVVYDGLTLDELANKLDKTLSSTLSGKGYLYASYCLEKGVDPYLAVAISMEETGCAWGCSNLVVTCNNVGGMKGSGCGEYAAFNTIDDGIKAFIDNIARNYVAYGLTTAETMNPKYAENPMWASNVNAYIARIKNK